MNVKHCVLCPVMPIEFILLLLVLFRM